MREAEGGVCVLITLHAGAPLPVVRMTRAAGPHTEEWYHFCRHCTCRYRVSTGWEGGREGKGDRGDREITVRRT